MTAEDNGWRSGVQRAETLWRLAANCSRVSGDYARGKRMH